jgi:CheY-like chemotaxis protein
VRSWPSGCSGFESGGGRVGPEERFTSCLLTYCAISALAHPITASVAPRRWGRFFMEAMIDANTELWKRWSLVSAVLTDTVSRYHKLLRGSRRPITKRTFWPTASGARYDRATGRRLFKPLSLRPWSRPLNLQPSSSDTWTIERSQGRRYLRVTSGKVTVPQDPLIACIDDDESVRDAIEGFLRAFGFAVKAFSSAQEFLQSSFLNQTSCLIADVKLPGLSGLQLQDRLTASGQRAPTIFITAFSDLHRRAQPLSGGAICFLERPITNDELLSCIRPPQWRQNGAAPRPRSNCGYSPSCLNLA